MMNKIPRQNLKKDKEDFIFLIFSTITGVITMKKMMQNKVPSNKPDTILMKSYVPPMMNSNK